VDIPATSKWTLFR